MVMMPGPSAARNSKVLRRNLLIEWMVLLIQYIRDDGPPRKMVAQGEISEAGSPQDPPIIDERVGGGPYGSDGVFGLSFMIVPKLGRMRWRVRGGAWSPQGLCGRCDRDISRNRP